MAMEIFLIISFVVVLGMAGFAYAMALRTINHRGLVIRRLLINMAQWASDEDGIPDYAWHDYRQGVRAIGMGSLPPMAWPIHADGDPTKI